MSEMCDDRLAPGRQGAAEAKHKKKDGDSARSNQRGVVPI